MAKSVDPRVLFAIEYEDGLGLIVWRLSADQLAFGIVENGKPIAQIPLANGAVAELAVELGGAVPEALASLAETLPQPIALALAAALIAPHMSELLGAAALVKQARALERGEGVVESA